MASIRQREGKWQARICRKGYPQEVKSFDSKQDAQKWARQIEGSIDRGTYHPIGYAKDLLLRDLLHRYIDEVTPTKRGAKRESEGLRFIQRQRVASYSMAVLSPAAIAEYRDERLKTVSAGTVIRELSILSSVINHARREWSLPITNPCEMVRKPATPPGRERILSLDEERRLLNELYPTGRRSPWMTPVVLVALETAMRRGELLGLRWIHVDLLPNLVRNYHRVCG